MKRCGRCGQTKSEPSFNRSNKNPDGLHQWCRACQREYYKASDHNGLRQREEKLDGLGTRKLQSLLNKGW